MMSIVDILFVVYVVAIGGYLMFPLLRGRCAVLEAPVLRMMVAGLAGLVVAELLTRSLLADDRNTAAVIATGTASGLVLVLGAAVINQIRGWLILNEDDGRARELAVRTVALLGYSYSIKGRNIDLSHPAGHVYVGPIGPKAVRVRFSSPYKSPRFRLFLSGYRKQLIFESGRRHVEPIHAELTSGEEPMPKELEGGSHEARKRARDKRPGGEGL